MLVPALLTKARERLDDRLPAAAYQISGEDEDVDARWKTDELLGYLTEAEKEVCYRVRPLIDSTTADLCALDLEVDTNSYALDPRVLSIIRFYVPGLPHGRPLQRTTYRYLDENHPGWQERSGDPESYCLDLDRGLIWLDRKPLVEYAGGVLTVHRLPLADLALAIEPTTADPAAVLTDSVELEIPAQYHVDLLDWVEHLAYLKRDVETYNEQRSAAAGARFERKFGPRPNAAAMERLLRGSVRRCRPQYL